MSAGESAPGRDVPKHEQRSPFVGGTNAASCSITDGRAASRPSSTEQRLLRHVASRATASLDGADWTGEADVPHRRALRVDLARELSATRSSPSCGRRRAGRASRRPSAPASRRHAARPAPPRGRSRGVSASSSAGSFARVRRRIAVEAAAVSSAQVPDCSSGRFVSPRARTASSAVPSSGRVALSRGGSRRRGPTVRRGRCRARTALRRSGTRAGGTSNGYTSARRLGGHTLDLLRSHVGDRAEELTGRGRSRRPSRGLRKAESVR